MQAEARPPVAVEFHRRGLAMFYSVMAIIFVALGVLFLMVGLGEAVGKQPWSDKWLPLIEWCVAGFAWMLGAPQMWKMGRAYRQNFVRLSATDVTFHTVLGKHFQIPYHAMTSIDWDSSARKRILTIHTNDVQYTFDQRACPRLGTVAKLLREQLNQE